MQIETRAIALSDSTARAEAQLGCAPMPGEDDDELSGASGRAVVHAIANALAIVSGNLTFAIESLDDGAPDLDELRVVLREANEGTRRIEDILQSMRSVRTPPPRRARVMVIDDEPRIGDSIKRVLSRECDVVCFADAGTALAAIERGDGYDAVLCDVRMPGMSGPELHAELVRRGSALAARVIFVTGERGDLPTPAAVPVLPKPFRVNELRAVLADAMKR